MGRTEQTVSQIEIPAGNWAAHQLRLVYDDTKDLFSSRLSHRESAKFQSQYSLQFMPRSPNSGCSAYRSSHNERNAITSAMRDDKRRGDNLSRPYGTIKEAICPENTQSHDFRDWNIPTRLIREKLNRKEHLPAGNEIHELSASLGKVSVELDSCQSISCDALPPSPIPSERSSPNSQVSSSQSDNKNTNNTAWKPLPTVSKFPNKVEVRPHTQPELKTFPSVSPMKTFPSVSPMKTFPSVSPMPTTTPDEKGSCRSVGKYSSHKDTKPATEIPETKRTGNKVNNQKKVADAMRVAELNYKIDCVLKRALFPDIYYTVKKRLINLPTVEQEMILKFFKKKAEAITEVRRSEKLKELLNFLMRGKQFGDGKQSNENQRKSLEQSSLHKAAVSSQTRETFRVDYLAPSADP